ncbi:MAG TPA: restriction endonuclease subunit S, partial [Flavobacteriales bacterium]|nr:restriction endonuclease subunit S [Flavobacteriales bacterium]
MTQLAQDTRRTTMAKAARMQPNPHWAKLPLFDRKGWEKLPFGDIADCISERADPKEEADAVYVGLEHLDPQDLHIRRWGKGSDVEGVKLRFYKGDIIFGRRRAYQRKLAVAEVDGICSAHAMVLRAKPGKCLPEFLPFLMMSDAFMQRAVEISVGSLSPTISWKVLKLQEFSLPPLEQQRRMAELLWAVDEVVERYLVLEQSILTVVDSIRSAHFDGVLADVPIQSIEDVGKWSTGNTPSRRIPEYWKGDFPWASPKDMKTALLEDTQEHLTASGKQQGVVVPPGTLMIVVRGMILAHSFPVCITGSEMAFNQDIKAFTPESNLDVRYVYQWFKWMTPRILGMTSTTSHGTKRLMMEDFGRLPFPLIPNAEQEAFLKRIHEVELLNEAWIQPINATDCSWGHAFK